MINALAQIPNKIRDLIEAHAKKLEDAWANTGEGTLLIAFPTKIGLKNGKNFCEVGINFSVEKCQDSTTFEWNNKQLNLLNSPDIKSIHAAGMTRGQAK